MLLDNYQFHPIHLLYLPLSLIGLIVAKVLIFLVGNKIKYEYLKRTPDYAKFPKAKAPEKNAFFFGKRIFEFIEKYRRSDGSFDKVFVIGPSAVTGSPSIGICDADMFREIINNHEVWGKPYVDAKDILGEGLVLATGKLWNAERRNLTPLFHFNALKEMIPNMVDTTKVLIKEIKEKRMDLTFTSSEDIFLEHAMKNILNLAFGGDIDPKWMTHQWDELLSAGPVYLVIKFLFGKTLAKWFPFKNTLTTRARIANQVKQLIAHRKHQKLDKHDMLSTLLNSTIEGKPVPEDIIVDEGVTFLLAGHDTTANLLSWTCYFLSKNPEVQEKLQRHVDEVLNGEAPSMENLPKLTYVKATLDETLRFTSALAVAPRTCNRDVDLNGYHFPKGCEVALLLRAIHTSPEHWGPTYMEYRPDRFLEDDQVKRHAFAFIPFLAGPRNCIGKKFAIQEATVTLAMLAQHFTVEHNPSKKIVEVQKGALCPTGLELKFYNRDDAPECRY